MKTLSALPAAGHAPLDAPAKVAAESEGSDTGLLLMLAAFALLLVALASGSLLRLMRQLATPGRGF